MTTPLSHQLYHTDNKSESKKVSLTKENKRPRILKGLTKWFSFSQVRVVPLGGVEVQRAGSVLVAMHLFVW